MDIQLRARTVSARTHAMVASELLPRREEGVPLAGQIMSMVLSLVATTVLTLFMTRRVLAIRAWRRLPLVVWLVFAIYVDSYAFVFGSALLQHSLGLNSSMGVCDSAILLCLICYVTTKIFIYLFLVEKAHIMRPIPKQRWRSKLYLFNSLGMLGVYIVVVLLNFIFRIAKMESGACIIGMESIAMIPLISFDTVVNVYLTIMFLIPLKRLYTFKNMPRSPANIRLRSIAVRTFCGAAFTLVSSIVNLLVLMVLDGEPGWVCLMCCNSDILFSAVVIQWVTTKDNAGTSSTASSRGATIQQDVTAHGSLRASTPCQHYPTPWMMTELSLVSGSHSHFCFEDAEDALDSPTMPRRSIAHAGAARQMLARADDSAGPNEDEGSSYMADGAGQKIGRPLLNEAG